MCSDYGVPSRRAFILVTGMGSTGPLWLLGPLATNVAQWDGSSRGATSISSPMVQEVVAGFQGWDLILRLVLG